MNIVRVQAICREDGHTHKNFKFVLMCGIGASRQIEDGEWMGYVKNESVLWPFILKQGSSCFYGGEEHSFEPTNIGLGSIEVGRLFTIFSQPGEVEPWESTYEIIRCYAYQG